MRFSLIIYERGEVDFVGALVGTFVGTLAGAISSVGELVGTLVGTLMDSVGALVGNLLGAVVAGLLDCMIVGDCDDALTACGRSEGAVVVGLAAMGLTDGLNVGFAVIVATGLEM